MLDDLLHWLIAFRTDAARLLSVLGTRLIRIHALAGIGIALFTIPISAGH